MSRSPLRFVCRCVVLGDLKLQNSRHYIPTDSFPVGAEAGFLLLIPIVGWSIQDSTLGDITDK